MKKNRHFLFTMLVAMIISLLGGRMSANNPATPPMFPSIILYHEYCHVVQQQANNGWTGFYSKYLYEVVKCFFSKLPIYKTEGTLDYEADQYYKFFIK